MEHFLLYPEDGIEETLNEGAVANLQNAFSELTAQFSLMRAASAHREEEMTHFVENIAHQIKNAATALQIRLDILQMKLKLPDEVEALKKSQLCMNRLTPACIRQNNDGSGKNRSFGSNKGMLR